MFSMQKIAEMFLWLPPILLALTIHEYMHGYTAYRLGDPTAKNNGRLSLNPLVHLDPIGTILLIVAHFGWAKPVPVDPRYFRNPRRDMMIVSIAGPAANLAMALLTGFIILIINTLRIPIHDIAARMLIINMDINVILMAFNLLPIPPLDGSKIMFGLFNIRAETQYTLSKYGPMILLGVIMLGRFSGVSIIGLYMSPFRMLFYLIFL